jgi:hypothetical protein
MKTFIEKQIFAPLRWRFKSWRLSMVGIAARFFRVPIAIHTEYFPVEPKARRERRKLKKQKEVCG